MRLITSIELTKYSASELRTLFGQVSRDTTRSHYGSPERRNGLASLENIHRALLQRYADLRS